MTLGISNLRHQSLMTILTRRTILIRYKLLKGSMNLNSIIMKVLYLDYRQIEGYASLSHEHLKKKNKARKAKA